MEKLQIVKKTLKPFKGDKGEMIPYAFYKAKRESDGVTIEFGSKVTTHEVGDNLELLLEKNEALRGGKVVFRYKEVVTA